MVEPRVHGLFERKGHEFVAFDVAAFDADKRPVLAARMRAICKPCCVTTSRAVLGRARKITARYSDGIPVAVSFDSRCLQTNAALAL